MMRVIIHALIWNLRNKVDWKSYKCPWVVCHGLMKCMFLKQQLFSAGATTQSLKEKLDTAWFHETVFTKINMIEKGIPLQSFQTFMPHTLWCSMFNSHLTWWSKRLLTRTLSVWLTTDSDNYTALKMSFLEILAQILGTYRNNMLTLEWLKIRCSLNWFNVNECEKACLVWFLQSQYLQI